MIEPEQTEMEMSWKHYEEKQETDGGSDLSRTVQNIADELDQLLHGLNRLTGQEVLLVGRVEDDYGGHFYLTEEKKREKKSRKHAV